MAGLFRDFLGGLGLDGWRIELVATVEDPIPLPRGRTLVTLQGGADYIMKLSKADRDLPEWQAAGEALIMAAEDRGPLLHARVGMLRALNRHVVREFNPDLKETHWGKRKLKRDE